MSADVARVVGQYFGVPEGVIERALGVALRVVGRLDTAQVGSLTIIDDSFNANPLSMKFALDTLNRVAKVGARRVAVLGNMGELGASAAMYHEEIADYAANKADVVIGVGTSAKLYRAAHWFPNATSCAARLTEVIKAGDCVLVKGSHSVRLHRVVKRIRELVEDGAF